MTGVLQLAQVLLCLTFFVFMLIAPQGFWKTLHALKRKGSAIEADIKATVSEHQRREAVDIREALDRTDAKVDGTKYFVDKLSKAIDYAIRRHDWYEDQRSRIFQAVVAVASAMLVLAGIFVKIEQVPQGLNIPIVFGFTVIALIALIFTIRDYNAELDRDRPYRLVSDIRFWYFRYNLPHHTSGLHEGGLSAQANAVLADRKRHLDRALENLDPINSVREDLEQLFILHVLQQYKSESLTRMRRRLSLLLIFFALEVLIAGFAYAVGSK